MSSCEGHNSVVWTILAGPPNSTAGHGGFGGTAVFVVLAVLIVVGTAVSLYRRRGR